MGAGHSHAPAHAGGRHRWRLAIAFCLIATFFVVELVYALITGSLALLSDAGHMAGDVVALGAALAATKLAVRSDKTGRRTFGSYRVEIFASGLSVLIMLGVSTFIVVEAIRRLGQDVEISTGPMLVVGALGLLVNLIALFLLFGGSKESLNVKGAYLEVMADTLGSVGVLVAGGLVIWTRNPIWDTVVALAIGAFIVVRALMLGREVLAVLGQQAPKEIALDKMTATLEAVDGVRDVHDLHVWTLTSGMHVATAHVVVDDAARVEPVLAAAQELLQEKFGIVHPTLQVEVADSTACASEADPHCAITTGTEQSEGSGHGHGHA